MGDTATVRPVVTPVTATVEELEAQGARAAQAVARCDGEIAALHDRRRRLSLDVVSGDAGATATLGEIHAEVARLQADRQLAEEAADADVEAARVALADTARPAAEAVVRLLAAGDRRQAAEYLLGLPPRSHRRELTAEAAELLKFILFEQDVPILGHPTITIERRAAERQRRERQLAEMEAVEAATAAAG